MIQALGKKLPDDRFGGQTKRIFAQSQRLAQ